MKFTKHLIALSLGVVAASALAGCGNKKTNSSKSSSDASSSETTVTFWNNYTEDPDGRGTANDSDYKAYWYMVDMIAEFEKKNPTIHIETHAYDKYSTIANEVNKVLEGGKTPSMALTYGTFAYNWEKYLVDVTDKGLAMEKDSDIISSYMDVEKQQYGGSKYYTLPFGKATEALMLNHEVFNAVGSEAAGVKQKDGYPAPSAISTKKAYSHPETFYDMMQLAAQMKTDYPEIFATQKDGAGYFTACPLIYENGDDLFFTVMESAGIPYVAAVDSAKDGVLFNNDKAKEAVCQLKKWNNEGLICVAENLYLKDEVKNVHVYPSDVFSAGKCFMVIATTRGSNWMAQDGFTVDYTKLPKWDANSTVKATSMGGSICFFQKSNKAEQEAAIAFYDFLNETENLAKLSVATDFCPIRSSSYKTEEVKANIEAAKTGVTASSSVDEKVKALAGQVLNLNAEYAKSNETFMSPVNKYSASMRTAIDSMMINVFNKSATTDEEIKTLVDDEFQKAYQNSVK